MHLSPQFVDKDHRVFGDAGRGTGFALGTADANLLIILDPPRGCVRVGRSVVGPFGRVS